MLGRPPNVSAGPTARAAATPPLPFARMPPVCLVTAARRYLPVLLVLSALASHAAAQSVQTVRGTVVDGATRAPLPGTSVVVLGTDPLLGAATDADGRFVIKRVPVGRWDVRASYIGYEPSLLPEVLVMAGKEAVLTVALREQAFEGEAVVVTPEARKDVPLSEMALVSARSFSVEETRRYAGGLDDPARMASAFAGVTTTGGTQENALVIRGNAPKGVQWRLEGVEIPNPNHFAGLTVAGGGGITLFSAHLLDDSDFFTGAFPAAYGNALAGVFDVRFRSGNPAAREHAVQVGLLGIDVSSEGPFRTGPPVAAPPATYLFNYRYSTLGLLMPLLPTEGLITYQDLAFKVALPMSGAGRFEAWGLGGWDRQRKPATEDPDEWEYDFWDRTRMGLELGVGAAGVAHHLLLGPRTYLHTVAAVTAHHTALDHDRLDDDVVLRPDLALRSTTGRAMLGSTLRHKFGARHVNETGVTAQRLFYDLDLQTAPDGASPTPGGALLVPIAAERGGTTLFQLFTQSRFSPSPRLTLTAGAHAQAFALTEAVLVEPRASARWALGDAGALTLGYGLHSQIEDLRVYFARPDGASMPNRSLGPARAHHLVLGYDRRLGPTARLKLEAYVQRLFDVPVVPDSSFSLLNFEQDWTFAEALTNDGAGRNFGVELTLDRFLRDGYYVLLTGALFRSEYRGGDGVWRRTRFDQGGAANALAGREFSLRGGRHLLGLNGRLVATGGKRRSPVDAAASERREEVVLDETRAFTVRMPATVLLDLTVTFRTNRRRFSDVWALQLKNVLAAEDVALDYNYALGRVKEVREGFPLPVLSYKVEF